MVFDINTTVIQQLFFLLLNTSYIQHCAKALGTQNRNTNCDFFFLTDCDNWG